MTDIGVLYIVLFCVVMGAFLLSGWVFFSFGRKGKMSGKDLKYIRGHWDRILEISEENPKGAILDADKLLDYALKTKGFKGSLGEKLKKHGACFSDLNGIWAAHKLRNRVAHELGDVRKAEVKSALRSFKKGLEDLGAKL